jgi:hypothetical protein
LLVIDNLYENIYPIEAADPNVSPLLLLLLALLLVLVLGVEDEVEAVVLLPELGVTRVAVAFDVPLLLFTIKLLPFIPLPLIAVLF